ncbi:Uncharacterized protein PECH_003147 [Penicillium ucsense]|uniref:NAD(P)-binding domain-containing protein n=1 Tax=Penicillium ucsense TaxID=2839758 RepID=A0A8J8W5Y3_9EURO|nr:Uncharacterized protein PECM_004912 [Penicillium ucsense]KAF7737658.1 Uncharacterized protein PECH_003147 [Penicillium ucsense]
MTSLPQTIAFFGASGGVGLSALKHSLASGIQCTALCRTPSKLEALLPQESNPNLKIIQGDAHDINAVTQCIRNLDGNLVDMIITTIGSRPVMPTMKIEDPNCCRNGAAALTEAISQLRSKGATGHPHIVLFSTTGISRYGRDYPLILYPIYKWLLEEAHEDKKITEDRFIESGETFTIIHGSLLTNGETQKEVQVGIEDPQTGRESAAIGYFISREDSGKWIADNIIKHNAEKYTNKIVMITT